jgi:hypothetical protein
MSALVVFCRFTVVTGGMAKMFLCLLVKLRSFFRHRRFLAG